uniref:SH3 domain-containing protein n=1 Tax=Romanomermis culicivorax TaxID=13658 RepID=A0A915K2X2_ROMCU
MVEWGRLNHLTWNYPISLVIVIDKERFPVHKIIHLFVAGSLRDKEEQRLQDEFRNARPSSRNREIHDENVTLTRSQFSSRKAQNQTALNGDQAADDWVQEDVQLPPYRENMYYFEGRSVPMTESYLHQPVRPLNCDMGLFKGSKGDLSMRDNVSLISAKENQENLEKNQLQKLSKRASGNTQRPNLPYVLMKKSNKKKLSVLTYENAPWRLKIRKELFYPNESLDEEELMNLLFYQIISDCKEPNPFRIRPKDRDMVANHLRSYDVNFTSMQNEKITNGLKKSVIDIARSWPLYFCKMFPIVEDRESEFLAQLLGLSENGIFLLYRNVSNSDEPLKILDRFGFDDLDKSEVFSNNLLVLTTVTGICVRIFTPKAEIIKNLIDEFLFGPNQGKQFVRAISDYITKEPNLLNFNKGDIIQLLPNMQDNQLDSGWLYGKLNNKFGNFPAEYVEPLHGNNSNLPPHLLNNDIGEANGLEMDFDAFLMVSLTRKLTVKANLNKVQLLTENLLLHLLDK